jgi:hypothetical protein
LTLLLSARDELKPHRSPIWRLVPDEVLWALGFER